MNPDRARKASKAPPRASGYCLYCYAPLPNPEGARDVCAHCGKVNLKIDRRTFWTKEPWIVRIERTLKMVVMVPAVLLTLAAPFVGGGGTPAGGFALFAPLILGIIVWQTLSKITRWDPHLDARILWTAVFALIALPPIGLLCAWTVAFLGLSIIESITGTRPFVDVGPSMLIAAATTTTVLGALASFATWKGGAALDRWRRRRIERGPSGPSGFSGPARSLDKTVPARP